MALTLFTGLDESFELRLLFEALRAQADPKGDQNVIGVSTTIGTNAQILPNVSGIWTARRERARRAGYARSIRPSASICGTVIESFPAFVSSGCDAKRATTISAFGATYRR